MTGKPLKIYVAGHSGMVGSALVRKLEQRAGVRIIRRSHAELDLAQQEAVREFFAAEQPDAVILAAAKVGGIHANSTYPADFIYDNLIIACNVIHQAFTASVRRLLFLGSSCIYPKAAIQPMKETSLLTGPLEASNEPYAIAKIAGIKLCESYNRQHGVDYRSVMPTNLYGPCDNFHSANAHVLPALLRRFHEAVKHGHKEVAIWGTGTPRREFLHVDDMADAALFVFDLAEEKYRSVTQPMSSHLNVGTGEDVTISQLAHIIGNITGFRGEVVFDIQKPDGAARKLLDVSRLRDLGWQARIGLRDGIASTYQWYLENETKIRN